MWEDNGPSFVTMTKEANNWKKTVTKSPLMTIYIYNSDDKETEN